MKRKVLFTILCLSFALSACGNEEQVTETPNITITVEESELMPQTPVVVEKVQDTETVSENDTAFQNKFVSLSDVPYDEAEPFQIYCTIMKNDFYALTLRSTKDAENFLDVVIPDQELALGILSLDSDISIFPQYKDAKAEDAKFYNDYTWREFIEIRPGMGIFDEETPDDETVQEEDTKDEAPADQVVQDNLEPQEREDASDSDAVDSTVSETQEEEIKEEPVLEETEQEEVIKEAAKNDFPVYELTGFCLKFGNQKSSVITNAEQLQQVLSEMGY